MSEVIELDGSGTRTSGARTSEGAASAPFFVRGQLVEGADARHKSRDLGVDFATPQLDLDALITPRTEPGPLEPQPS